MSFIVKCEKCSTEQRISELLNNPEANPKIIVDIIEDCMTDTILFQCLNCKEELEF